MAKKNVNAEEIVNDNPTDDPAPFGYKPDGTPRQRAPRQPIPPEMRSVYVIYGINKGNAAKSIVTTEKSMRSVMKTLEKWRGLLINNYSAVEVVRSRRVLFTEF